MFITTIDHWHRHYRGHPSRVPAWEGLAQGPVLAAFKSALAASVRDPQEVILVRSVHLRFRVGTGDYSPTELADHWGRAMARAVQETLDRNDPAVVRRFPNATEHLADFIEALLTDRDSRAWFFAGFEKCRRDDLGETLETLVETHLDVWSDLMARLAPRGLLLPLLRRVRIATHGRLWFSGIRGIDPQTSVEAERPIFAAALQIFARLCGRQWQSTEADRAFAAYVAQPRPRTDWNDTTHLAEAVADAVRFLADRFSDAVPAAEKIGDAVQPFDWLDRDWLQRRLLTRFGPVNERTGPAVGQLDDQGDGAAARGRAGPSPRLIEYAAIWEREKIHFFRDWDAADPAGPHNRLLALSLLVARHPEWVHEPAVALFVEHLLSRLPHEQANRILAAADRAGDATGDTAGPAGIGRRDQRQDQPGMPAVDSEPLTEFAGVFLLLRAIHDLRLLSLARQTQFPGADDAAPARLLRDLACRWRQRPAPTRADPGMLALVRLAAPVKWNYLLEEGLLEEGLLEEGLLEEGVPAEAPAAQLFQTQLAKTLAAQGTWPAASGLRVRRARTAVGEECLLGGDREGKLFPWAALVSTREQARQVVVGWCSAVSAWMGTSFDLLVEEDVVRIYGDLGGTPVVRNRPVASLLWSPGPVRCDDALRDLTLASTADVLVRHWARWIRGIGASSTEYLLRQAIWRSGTIHVLPHRIRVRLHSCPVDPALRVSGAFEPLDFFTGHGVTRIEFD